METFKHSLSLQNKTHNKKATVNQRAPWHIEYLLMDKHLIESNLLKSCLR